MRVEPISDSKFKVISGLTSNIVDISSRECSCQVFQMDLFPCSHAAATIRYEIIWYKRIRYELFIFTNTNVRKMVKGDEFHTGL